MKLKLKVLDNAVPALLTFLDNGVPALLTLIVSIIMTAIILFFAYKADMVMQLMLGCLILNAMFILIDKIYKKSLNLVCIFGFFCSALYFYML